MPSIKFEVTKKHFRDEADGEQHVIWLKTIAGAEQSFGSSSPCQEEHRSLIVDARTFGRLKRGDVLVLVNEDDLRDANNDAHGRGVVEAL